MLHLVAVYMGGPRGWHRTLCNPALHLGSDINQHFVHATTLANTKPLQDGQYALACLPAKTEQHFVAELPCRQVMAQPNVSAEARTICTRPACRCANNMPVGGQVLATNKH